MADKSELKQVTIQARSVIDHHETVESMKQPPKAFVLAASADIGLGLSERLIEDGWHVVGTGRDSNRFEALLERPEFDFLPCDLSNPGSVKSLVHAFGKLNHEWDLFVSAAGTLEPIGPFFELDFDQWEVSVSVNVISQLRALRGVWPHRRKNAVVDVMFLAGGGTNSPFTNYSAYCVSKIALIKMCELLDDEEPDLNAFIIGPGFVRTRIHGETFRAGRAGCIPVRSIWA